jgi:hypothetical protein
MDYGYFNQFIGREVDQAWWGTRTEHIVGTTFDDQRAFNSTKQRYSYVVLYLL